MRRLPILLAFLIFAGCDSNDVLSDAQLFIGDWRLAEISDAEGDRTAQFGALGTIETTFAAGGQYQLVFDAAGGGQDVQLGGTYQVFPADGVLRLMVPTGQFILPVDLQYRFLNDNSVELLIDAAILGTIIQAANYTGQVRMALSRR
jgi:hypothetical protein